MPVVIACLVCVAVFIVLAWSCLVIAGREEQRAEKWMGKAEDMMREDEDEPEPKRRPQEIHIEIVSRGGSDDAETESQDQFTP